MCATSGLGAFFFQHLAVDRAASPLHPNATTARLCLEFYRWHQGPTPVCTRLAPAGARPFPAPTSAHLGPANKLGRAAIQLRFLRTAHVSTSTSFAMACWPPPPIKNLALPKTRPKRLPQNFLTLKTKCEDLLAAPLRLLIADGSGGRRPSPHAVPPRPIEMWAVLEDPSTPAALRISELCGHASGRYRLASAASSGCAGKGKKERLLPIGPHRPGYHS